MSDQWDMDKAYPPILWKDYDKVARPLVAEWVRCAGLTCDSEYALGELSDELRDVVVRLLTHGGRTRVLRMDGEHIKKEAK